MLVDDLAIYSVHIDPYSAARRVAQLQILAERLPTGYNVVLGDFNLAPRLGVGQTVAARQTVPGRAAQSGRLHRSAWHARRRGLPVPARAAWSEPRGVALGFASPNGWNDGVRGTVMRKLMLMALSPVKPEGENPQ